MGKEDSLKVGGWYLEALVFNELFLRTGALVKFIAFG
jgi:hypothetical protein